MVAYAVLAGASVTSRCVEGWNTARVHGIGVAIESTILLAEVDARFIPDHVTTEGVDTTYAVFAFASTAARRVFGNTARNTVCYGFAHTSALRTDRICGTGISIVATASFI